MADDLTGFCGNAGPEEIMDGLAANPGSCRAKQRARQWFSPAAPHPFEEIDPSWNTRRIDALESDCRASRVDM